MILVTGGTGLLGAHILVELAKENQPLRALHRSSSNINQTKNIFDYYFNSEAKAKFALIEWVEGDIVDVVSLEKAMRGCSIVYHSAAMVSFVKQDFKHMMDINKGGTANVVNIALSLGVQHLVYISSVAALGRDGRKDFYDESNKWKSSPENSGYAISKFAAENEVWRGIEEGLPAVILNPTIILGPGNWNESSVTFFKALRKGMAFYPSGTNGFVDARDVAKIAKILSGKKIFNERFVTVGHNLRFYDLFSKIALSYGKKPPKYSIKKWMLAIAWRVDGFLSLFGKKRSVTKENARSSYSHSIYSNEKIREKIGYSFYPIDDTIANASTYFKSHKF